MLMSRTPIDVVDLLPIRQLLFLHLKNNILIKSSHLKIRSSAASSNLWEVGFHEHLLRNPTVLVGLMEESTRLGI